MKKYLKLLFPPFWLILILTFFCTFALIYIFLNGFDMHPLAYLLYVLSFYSLIVLTLFIAKFAPKAFLHSKQKINRTRIGHQYLTNIAYKTKISLYFSLGINLAYALMKLTYGIYFTSFWWIAIAIYYIVLSLIRFSLLTYMSKNYSQLENYKRYRLCGWLMALVNLSLSGIIFQMIWQDKTYSYPEIMVIAMAAYTFYTLTMSIIDWFRYRKNENPILSAAKIIRLVSSIVSILTLETAMLTAFGNDIFFNKIMITLTGTAVCIIVLVISFLMIQNASKQIKNLLSED